ncbi:hypothetical protein BaRGS_00018568, partial [Batillaria attramentaria]
GDILRELRYSSRDKSRDHGGSAVPSQRTSIFLYSQSLQCLETCLKFRFILFGNEFWIISNTRSLPEGKKQAWDIQRHILGKQNTQSYEDLKKDQQQESMKCELSKDIDVVSMLPRYT